MLLETRRSLNGFSCELTDGESPAAGSHRTRRRYCNSIPSATTACLLFPPFPAEEVEDLRDALVVKENFSRIPVYKIIHLATPLSATRSTAGKCRILLPSLKRIKRSSRSTRVKSKVKNELGKRKNKISRICLWLYYKGTALKSTYCIP